MRYIVYGAGGGGCANGTPLAHIDARHELGALMENLGEP